MNCELAEAPGIFGFFFFFLKPMVFVSNEEDESPVRQQADRWDGVQG